MSSTLMMPEDVVARKLLMDVPIVGLLFEFYRRKLTLCLCFAIL